MIIKKEISSDITLEYDTENDKFNVNYQLDVLETLSYEDFLKVKSFCKAVDLMLQTGIK